MLISWLGDKASIGTLFVLFQKDNSYHSGIKQSTHKTLFGIEAKVGLCVTVILQKVLEMMVTEDDLLEKPLSDLPLH